MKQDEWGFFRHIKELFNQVLTVEGAMLVASMYTCVRVLTAGPEWAAWPAIVWNGAMIANRTGRWVLPSFVEKFLAAKYGNGVPKPS